MLTADTLVVIGCLTLGGATFLRLLCGARGAAVAEAERRCASEAANVLAVSTSLPEVSGDDPG